MKGQVSAIAQQRSHRREERDDRTTSNPFTSTKKQKGSGHPAKRVT